MINLLQISNNQFWEQIRDNYKDMGGVYKIVSLNNGIITPINRLLGVDNDGILYIGKADSFIDRVINLKKSISPEYKGTSHICGRRYKSNAKIVEKFPYESLFIMFIPSSQPKELENKYLEEYFNTFGEVPPLNAIR